MQVKADDATRISELLERFRAELMTLSADALLQPKISRERASELTGILLTNFAKAEPLMDQELSPARASERRQQLRLLRDRALTFFGADMERERSLGGRRTRRAELAERVANHDRHLLRWARALFAEDKETAEVLDDIQSGTGYQDDAEDVLRLVKLYRSQWHLASGQTYVTRAYLDTAEAEATELVTLLHNEADNGVRELVRRAYTAWSRDYEELMALGRYLLRKTGNVEILFPGIFSERSRTSPSSEPEPDDGAAEDGSNADGEAGPASSGTEPAPSNTAGLKDG